MENKIIQYCFTIYCQDNLLLWAMFICFLGILFVGRIMLSANKFILNKSGKSISIIQLEVPKSYMTFKELLDDMTEKAKSAVSLNLKLDYIFMAFLYPLMYLLATYILHKTDMSQVWKSGLGFIRILPFITWLFDIAENKITFSAISQASKMKILWLRLVSYSKWITGLFYLLFLIVMGVVWLFNNDELRSVLFCN